MVARREKTGALAAIAAKRRRRTKWAALRAAATPERYARGHARDGAGAEKTGKRAGEGAANGAIAAKAAAAGATEAGK